MPFPGKNGKIINIQVRAYGCSRGDSTFFSFKIPESLKAGRLQCRSILTGPNPSLGHWRGLVGGRWQLLARWQHQN